MPQSLARILVHLVFSTKNREGVLADEIRDRLHAYIAGIVENQGGCLLKAGSVPDHIHLLIAHPRTCSPSELVREIKTGSSKWLKTQDSRYGEFHWQGGYGLFSVSPGHRQAVEAYLGNQAEHHRRVSFQEEYRRLLDRYGVAYDERFVWDGDGSRPFRAWNNAWTPDPRRCLGLSHCAPLGRRAVEFRGPASESRTVLTGDSYAIPAASAPTGRTATARGNAPGGRGDRIPKP